MINLRLTGLMTGVLFLLIIMPLASADVIDPNYKPIEVTDKITNIGDFPDYVFINVELHPSGNYYINLIGGDGIIPQAYKFSGHSVYAVKKSDFEEKLLLHFDDNNKSQKDAYSAQREYLQNFLNSSKAIKILDKIGSYQTVPVLSTETSRTYLYTINLTDINNKNQEKVVVDKVVERNSSFYVYIIAPILASIAIILVLFMRRKR